MARMPRGSPPPLESGVLQKKVSHYQLCPVHITNMRINDTSTPVVVLMSGDHGPLGITRSLGRLGVPVYVIDPRRSTPSSFSKYCKGSYMWDIDSHSSSESLSFLESISRELSRRPILIPTTDPAAVFVADHLTRLSESFLIPELRPALVHGLSDKKQMYFLAKKHSVPTPETMFPSSKTDVLEFLDSATFPVMLKGIDGMRLWRRTGRKMFIVWSAGELLERYDAAEEPEFPNLMIQEYIPGGDDTIWMFNGYFSRSSDCLFGITGKKIRQCPIHTGATSLGICLENELVQQTTKMFMKGIGYQGILDIGYRYDARDGRFKVLDVNPRIGASFRLFTASNGMDVARALYLDLTGQDVPASAAEPGRTWLVEDSDLVSFYRYRQEGTLSLKEWLKSLGGVSETAYLTKDDLLPLVPLCIHRFAELAQRIGKQLSPESQKTRVAFPRAKLQGSAVLCSGEPKPADTDIS
jgi:D-aspartate ligase